MYLRISFLVLFAFLCQLQGVSQDLSNFTQFFINPYPINPSYAGIEGRPALFFAYRKQWSGIENSPTLFNASIHTAANNGLNYGINVSSDKRGIVSNSGALITVGYTVAIDNLKFIRFGISAGSSFNAVDLSVIPQNDPLLSDPAIANMLDKNISLIGNAGISFHLKSFHFGAALPSIFSPSYLTDQSFNVTELKPFQSVVIHASNRFYFAKDKNVFEPYIIYRMNSDLPSQIEAAGVVHLNHTIWVGGSWKQDFGISALGGFKYQNFFLIGGSYTLKNSGINELNSPSYEIQISYIFGPKPKGKKIPVYSFVNTTKEKEKRKTPTQIAAEKHKQEQALAKKKEEEAAIKKQQEERKQELAKREAETKKTSPVVVAPVVTKQETKPVTQQETKPVVTQQQETKPVTQQQETKPITQQETKPVVTQQETKPIVTQQQTNPVTQQETRPVTQQETKPVVTPPNRHDGGPRLKSGALDIELPTYDTAHHEEQARISRLDEHASDPDEHHGDDPAAHPNAERHEFVRRGSHQEELDLGDYVITGVFKGSANAKHFADGLKTLGFEADYGHLTEKNLWYVYIAQTTDINKAKAERDKFRKMKIFRDCWLLTVHE